MVKQRKSRSKRDITPQEDPSESISLRRNSGVYDSFTREDVAVHRKINQYTTDISEHEQSEIQLELLEKFVRMPKKIITRSMLTFINSSSDSTSTRRDPSPCRRSITPPLIQNQEVQQLIDPRSTGEVMERKTNQESYLDLRKDSCADQSVVQPSQLDFRSSGEATTMERFVPNVFENPWNMSSMSHILKGFELSSSISSRNKSQQTFGRSTFTMTGNSNNMCRLLQKPKLQELPEKPPGSLAKTKTPQAFRSTIVEKLPSFQDVLQPSLPKPSSNKTDVVVTSSLSEKPSEQGSTNGGKLWNIIYGSWDYLRGSLRSIKGSIYG